jgi:hypothetical protein
MGMFDINIQFVNYILSILAVVFGFGALWIVLSNETRRDQEIKDLRERINTLSRVDDNKKR